ncbi:exported hypothetical protein [Candidatus Sulfotelmatobacter kueseliae]|uniref:Uncharacterized protein n=1 Tax=Candidatus Sulfotelmatobacter kueseliae TaxID=2042962 RepID=A0A2U3KHN6_9BACT|nr:exported hypothetical protein [Candidatus Sulfotelmatobacter kueseliae]
MRRKYATFPRTIAKSACKKLMSTDALDTVALLGGCETNPANGVPSCYHESILGCQLPVLS